MTSPSLSEWVPAGTLAWIVHSLAEPVTARLLATTLVRLTACFKMRVYAQAVQAVQRNIM